MDETFLKVSRTLEKYHGIFSKIWQMGMPRITDTVRTAAVSFNKKGGYIEFLFNQKFLDTLNLEELGFVCAHECLHVILNHGVRLQGLNMDIANKAADISINELLLRYFGFSRSMPIVTSLPICLISNMFPNAKPGEVQPFREFEYYYNLLLQDGQGGGSGSGKVIDEHGNIPCDVMQEIADEISKFSREEIEKLETVMKAGDSSGYELIKSSLAFKPTKTWEKIIREWTVKAYREKMMNQWRITNRRFSIIEQYTDLLIPSDYEVDEKRARKIDLTFFMDVSGSCCEDSEKFFASAKTIPRDKFIIDAYAFNTEVIKVDLQSDTLPNGGGTSFHQLEEHLLKQRVYPSAVFVLTDGIGSNVLPKFPNRWHVFLTTDYKHCFPATVNFHSFKDIIKLVS